MPRTAYWRPVLLVVASLTGYAQSPPPTLSFEVASIFQRCNIVKLPRSETVTFW